MPARKSSARGSGDAGAAEREAVAPAPAKRSRPASRTVHAGGHVIKADPLPETPAESVQCSVCGGDPTSCGHGGGGGWAVEGEG